MNYKAPISSDLHTLRKETAGAADPPVPQETLFPYDFSRINDHGFRLAPRPYCFYRISMLILSSALFTLLLLYGPELRYALLVNKELRVPDVLGIHSPPRVLFSGGHISCSDEDYGSQAEGFSVEIPALPLLELAGRGGYDQWGILARLLPVHHPLPSSVEHTAQSSRYYTGRRGAPASVLYAALRRLSQSGVPVESLPQKIPHRYPPLLPRVQHALYPQYTSLYAE